MCQLPSPVFIAPLLIRGGKEDCKQHGEHPHRGKHPLHYGAREIVAGKCNCFAYSWSANMLPSEKPLADQVIYNSTLAAMLTHKIPKHQLDV